MWWLPGGQTTNQHDDTELNCGDLSQQEDAQQLLPLLQLLLPAVHAVER